MIRFSISLLFVFLIGPSSLAQNLDGRFRPFIEAAYELRVAQGALDAGMPFDSKSLGRTLDGLRVTLQRFENERKDVIPLLAASSGPNKIVVSRLGEISRRLTKVSQTLKDDVFIKEVKSLRDSIKVLLDAAFKYAKQNPPKEKVDRPLSERAQATLQELKELGQNDRLLSQIHNPDKMDSLMRGHIWKILTRLLPLAGQPELDEVYAVMKAYEDYVLLSRDDPRITERALNEAYRHISEAVFRNQPKIFDGRVIRPEGAEILVKHLRDIGVIPESLDVTIISDLLDIEKTLQEKLQNNETKRFFLIVYAQNHATLIYIDRAAGPLRALVVDSTGNRGQGGAVVFFVSNVLTQTDSWTFNVVTDRQGDTFNCLSFVLEDLKYIATQPDIFATLKVRENDSDSNIGLVECTAPGMGVATQKLAQLPKAALKNCVVKRKGFEREDRDHFVARNTHVRLVHDFDKGERVEKAQYLAMEKKAASNRLTLLKLRFNLK